MVLQQAHCLSSFPRSKSVFIHGSSNIHNRLGEAEKSHQKARQQGFNQFWTMVNVKHLDLDVARRESPTTTAFFSVAQITDPRTAEYAEFKELLLSELGL